MLDDNDPVGNQPKAGRAAKRVSRLSLFRIPKRSPELNVIDFAVWSEIERRIRRQGRRFPERARWRRGRPSSGASSGPRGTSPRRS